MFRFTIRDVLWLTVVAALVACWSLERLNSQRHRASWGHERATLQSTVADLQVSQQHIKEMSRVLDDPVMLKEMVLAADGDRIMREYKATHKGSSSAKP